MSEEKTAASDGGDTFSRGVTQALRDACLDIARRIAAKQAPVIAASMVRNESDIIEVFVRHTLGWADALLVIDHSSSDGTGDILRALREEGLPLGVVDDPAFGFHQASRMTEAARIAYEVLGAAVVAPLDADEFLFDVGGEDPAERLRQLAPDAAMFVPWRSYIPTPADLPDEPDVLKRITMRLRDQPSETPVKIIMGGRLTRAPDFRIAHGNHRAFAATRLIQATPVCDTLRLAHYPVRTSAQFASKIAAKTLSTPFAAERSPRAGWFYNHVISLFPAWWNLSATQLQNAAECYFDRLARPPLALLHDLLACADIERRHDDLARHDPVANIYDIANRMVQRLGAGGGGLVEYSTLHRPLTDENRRLRLSIARLAFGLGIEIDGMTVDEIELEMMRRMPTYPLRADPLNGERQ